MADVDQILDRENAEAWNHEMNGRMDLAIPLYQGLIEKRKRVYGENSLHVAKSCQELGEAYVDEGSFDEAEPVLQRALEIRAASATLPGDDEDDAAYDKRRDAAITRDTLGRVYEQRGDLESARAIRRAGLELGQIVCGYEWCDDDDVLLDGKACGICGKCGAAFYCCRECQAKDWRARHKQHCDTHNAAEALLELSIADASSSNANPGAVPSTEPTSGSVSAQSPVLPADNEGISADISGPVAAPTYKRKNKNKNKNKNRKERRKAKKSGENDQSGPSQSQTGPPDCLSRSEDAEHAEETRESQPPSNNTPQTPEAVEIVGPVEPVEPA